MVGVGVGVVGVDSAFFSSLESSREDRRRVRLGVFRLMASLLALRASMKPEASCRCSAAIQPHGRVSMVS